MGLQTSGEVVVGQVRLVRAGAEWYGRGVDRLSSSMRQSETPNPERRVLAP